MSSKNSLTATNLAVYQYLECDVFIHKVYNRSKSMKTGSDIANFPGIENPMFAKGIEWENNLLSWLDRSNLLMTIPSIPLDGDTLFEIILTDDRPYFFISGVCFWPPKEELDEITNRSGLPTINFGLAKPDLIEISKVDNLILWRVVDAKVSREIKDSHFIQIYFYTICLKYLLHRSVFRSTDSPGIWLPPSQLLQPSINDIKLVPMSLLSSTFDPLIFHKIPFIVNLTFEEIEWHFNPRCRNCNYEDECGTRARIEGTTGTIPNVSLADARTLKTVIKEARQSKPVTGENLLSDIEELHNAFANHDTSRRLAISYPAAFERAKHILAISVSGDRHISSPVIEAALTGSAQVIPRYNYTCPSREDIAIIISVVSSKYTTNQEDYMCITIHAEDRQDTLPQSILCRADQAVEKLSGLIDCITTARPTQSNGNSCQFYVWSPLESTALQDIIVNTALHHSSHDEGVQTCINTLSQGASVLQSNFQPPVLSGALLNFYRMGADSERIALIDRIGLSSEEPNETPHSRLNKEFERTRHERNSNSREVGRIPQVVILKSEVERQLALALPGYWDLPLCVSALLPNAEQCPSDEEILTVYNSETGTQRLKSLLLRRNGHIHSTLIELRRRISTVPGDKLLVNEGKPISSSSGFPALCKEPHIRKLFFMQQIEVLAKLTKLWQSRIDCCPQAPIIEYRFSTKNVNHEEHTFELKLGAIDPLSFESGFLLFDHILTRSDNSSGRHQPLEAFFDDVPLAGSIFPLSHKYISNWNSQDPRIKDGLLIAQIRRVYTDKGKSRTSVVINTWGNTTILEVGVSYRLSPRLVDFNTAKTLSALFEIDVKWEAERSLRPQGEAHGDIPYLQVAMSPMSLGEVHMAAWYLKSANVIQKLFRELTSLGNEKATFLVLKPSQNRAAKRMLSNRLSVIWGPPGSGKTHTISLSLLRLIEIEYIHHGPTEKVIFVTAFTHTAVSVCYAKFFQLLDIYRSVATLPCEWMSCMEAGVVLSGAEHIIKQRQQPTTRIFFGTIYQLSKLIKRMTVGIDCLVIDEAGQIPFGVASVVFRSLESTGRIVIAGDSEQLAPIFSMKYPRVDVMPIFGSVLECAMSSRGAGSVTSGCTPIMDDQVVQLVENFRMNPDLCDFISTIYSKELKSLKKRKLAMSSTMNTPSTITRPNNADRDIFAAVEKFISAIMQVMFRHPQSVLTKPRRSQTTKGPDRIGNTSNREISLTLIRVGFHRGSEADITYEAQVKAEASLAATLVLLLQASSPDERIFVAAPHRNQRQAVSTALAAITGKSGEKSAKWQTNNSNVTIDTIERLQGTFYFEYTSSITLLISAPRLGSEAEYVICLYSALQQGGPDADFLYERRRLNVAISRTKSLCILLVSDEVLRPSVKILTKETTARGYAFLKAYEERAWSYDITVNINDE